MPQVPEDRVFTPNFSFFRMPFHYDAVSFFWNYFKVPRSKVESYLAPTGLRAAQFSDLDPDEVIVSLNFQNYMSNLGFMLSTILEVEFNIHAYPISKEKETPLISFRDYIQGQEQTKWIGGFRLHVPANDTIAVQAGRTMFGERKFLTNFWFNVPVPNNPPQLSDPKNPNSKLLPQFWDYTTYDPSFQPSAGSLNTPTPPKVKPADVIYSLHGDLSKLPPPVLTNPSPMTLYSLLSGAGGPNPGPDVPPGNGRLDASRWNILGLDTTWFDVDKNPDASVTLKYGKSDHPMRVDMEKIIGKTEACCVRYYQSPPAAIENRAFWVEPLDADPTPPPTAGKSTAKRTQKS